ncbi:ecto-ADP-ribosyltransferase 5-like [Tachyglossus aculeatus]|uniref:ecto-ADP-ribosyltransferase 5-like n=1 Tax=Tachyglossus aculeatus TaxID=9261 RepID=UPI0018F60AB2|nr:ecto-ADP-ribosyltransferase 5-like [Tachyglossus aculeatus]
MERKAPVLLRMERGQSRFFAAVWDRAAATWAQQKLGQRLPAGFSDLHGTALVAYTNGTLLRHFHTAVRRYASSRTRYLARFRFKALHFYLTRGLQLLRGPCSGQPWKAAYRLCPGWLYPGQRGTVRLGQLASATLAPWPVADFDTLPAYAVYSCFSVPLGPFSGHSGHEEVLVSGNEEFTVVREKDQGWGGPSFALKSANRTCSHFNCAYLGGRRSAKCISRHRKRRSLHSSLPPSRTAQRSAAGVRNTVPGRLMSLFLPGLLVLLRSAGPDLWSAF